MTNNDIFLKAGAIAAVIFIGGLVFGIWLDTNRVDELRLGLTSIDLQWNDARLNSLYFQTFASTEDACPLAMEANKDFADKIFQQGEDLERAEQVERFAPSILLEKKRYALLQVQFWLNSMSLRNGCGSNHTSILYFYSHFDDNVDTAQNVQSGILTDMINECGFDRLNVSPLPIDLDISTIDTIVKTNNITQTPTLLINGNITLSGLQTRETLDKYVNCSQTETSS